MSDFTPIAGAVAKVHSGNRQLFAGEADVVSTQGVLLEGVAYVAGQVLGRVTASGKYAKHDPAAATGVEKAVAILAYDVPTPTVDKKEAIYVGGVFNMDELTFNAATNTDALKAAAFDGTNIVAQKLLGNPADGSGPV